LEPRIRRIEHFIDQSVSVPIQRWNIDSKSIRQFLEKPAVGLCLASSSHDRIGVLEIVVAVGCVDIGVFQECCCREEKVGIVRGIRLEVFEDNSQELVSQESLAHFG